MKSFIAVKRLRKVKFPKMESMLLKWFIAQRNRNVPISGPLLIEKAKFFHEKFEENYVFMASDGWLDGFKRRNGIRLLSIRGEKLSADFDSAGPFIEHLADKMREMKITRDQLYNADETGLFWQLLPVHVDERDAPGLKISKQRVTVLACTNATGSHKLTPLVIGKSKNPRCFKGWNNPLLYNNSQSAWMTSFIFKEWFFKNFVPEVSYIGSFIHLSERLNLFRNAQVKHFCRNNNLPEFLQMSRRYCNQ